MIDYFNQHMHSFWFGVGFLLLAIEAVALGFSTGFVLFIGLGALLTGGLLWFGVLPTTWTASIAFFGVSAAVISALLWKPLKKLQEANPVTKDNSSDLIGYKFRLDQTITTSQPGTTRYSGIDWRVEIDLDCPEPSIAAGSTVRVVSVEAGKFSVVPN